ncbi:hypothetical protein FGE12_27950 [Aggregicoccus sp. 17bor-14]|uniref:DUF3885 domain-containing protein n=1 Tax=Myxococcaceae TaxID=31 RepID=UPI00129D17BB|nr:MULTISPECIES: hypothetical protein [Myxococcaceae]MBF5046282.1 hypothetical protein [Simulacricoccus sp. 17bor-14]MRI92004.1 hypothetical protein [Aggregicoccus sp. 17bor-14]
MSAPELEDFLARWERWYPGVPPVPHVLRRAAEQTWLRAYTLFNVRHWADLEEVRSRYHALADHVLGPGAACALVTLRTTDALTLAPASLEALDEVLGESGNPLAGYGLRRLTRLTGSPALEESFEDAQVWLYGARVLWVAGAWDALLRACATGDVGSVMWVELHSGRAFSPFQGGADLFLPRAHERATARLRFAPWLAPLPER